MEKASFFSLLDWKQPKLIQPNHPITPWIVLINVTIITICVVITAFAPMISSSSIQGSLVIGKTLNTWISLSYLLTSAVIVPIADWVSHRYGYKRILFIATILFFFSSIIIGTTDSYFVVIICRILSGIGAATAYTNCLTFISLVFPKEKRTLPLVLYIASSFGIGMVMSFLLGGYVTDQLGWHSNFLFLSAIAPIAIGAIGCFFPETTKETRRHFDFIGAFFYLICIFSFVIWISNVKAPWNANGFSSFFSYALLLTTGTSFLFFILSTLSKKDPLFNLSLFKTRSFIIGCTATFFVACNFVPTVLTISIIFEEELLYSKYKAGLYLIPYGITMGLAGIASGLFSKKVGLNTFALIGIFLTLFSCFLNQNITIQSDHFDYQVMLIIRGAGVGFALGPLTALILKKVQPELIGQASVLVTLFRLLGASLGTNFTNIMEKIRLPFHLLRFGEQMQLHTPALEAYQKHLDLFLVKQRGSIPNHLLLGGHGYGDLSSLQSYQELFKYVKTQARIASINDAYLIIGIVLTLLMIIISFFILRGKWKEKKAISQ